MSWWSRTRRETEVTGGRLTQGALGSVEQMDLCPDVLIAFAFTTDNGQVKP